MIEKSFFGEGKNIEFKREIPRIHERFLKDIIAFSNGSGGKVILGIEDGTQRVYGIGGVNPFRLSDDISNMISDACTPQITPDITAQTLEGKTILVIEVPPGKFRPYYLKAEGKGRSVYVRINGTSRPADPALLKELEMEGSHIYYDCLPEIGMEFDREKAEALCAAMKETALLSCRTAEERAEVHDMTVEKLEDMGMLYKSGNDYLPTHAFALMTENKCRYAKIQCALFKGVDRDEFIDRKEFRGPVYQQIEEAYRFVLRHINRGTKIRGLVRTDAYELPVRAVREAIVNAVTHRSYLDDSCIQLSIYDDRVEIQSPGMLYGGLDMEEALKGKSKCRNAAISEAFYYMGIIEGWGTGLNRIRKSCREYGLKDPVITESGNGFLVVFFRKAVDEKRNGDSIAERSPEYAGRRTDKAIIESSTESITESSIENSTESIAQNSTESDVERRLLCLLRHDPTLTQQEAAERLGYSKAWIRKVMKKLQEEGRLQRRGATKKGLWIVTR